MKSDRFLTAGLVVAFCLLLLNPSFNNAVFAADDYPSQSIEFVVAFSPGGGTDVLARIVIEKINRDLKAEGKKGRMFVTNKPGSSGVVGLAYVLKSKPDGYTIGSIGGAQTYIAFLNPKNVPYTMNDIEPIANITHSLYGLYVQANSPYKTYADLAEYAKKHPGALTCSVVGKTSSVNMYFELLKFHQQFDIRSVPFSGAGPAATALLGGHVDMSGTNDTSIRSHVKAGKVRILFQFGDMRRYPGIPNTKDLGIEVPLAPNGVAAPTGISRDRFNKLASLFERALKDPEVREKLEGRGEIPYYLTGAELKKIHVNGSDLVQKVKDRLK